MSDIKFNCPQCGQHLAADAGATGVTVACPKCGQSILVPQLARLAKSEMSKTTKWPLVVSGVAVIALLGVGALLWQMQRRPTAQTASSRMSVTPKNDGTIAEGAALTPHAAADSPPKMTAPDTANVIAAAVEPARSDQGFDARAETTHKTEAVEHSGNFNNPEDQAWLAWAKRLPISANPLPQNNDRNEGLTLKDFSDCPLFGPKGPSEDDVFQADGGDCNFLARLAGLAAAHPDFIRKVVNDVGDGTYVVHYWRLQNHQQFVIRVNSELWVNSSGRPKYAQIGPDRAIWPAILEKAFALTRRPPYNYQAILGGGESICYIPVDWGFQPPLDESLPEPFSPQVVADWFNNGVSNCPTKNELIQSDKWLWFNSGAPHGPIRDAVFSCAIQRLKWIKAQLDAGTVVVVGASGRLNNDTPVTPPNPVEIEKHLPRTDTYRFAQHIYTVDRVPTDKDGKPIGVILRKIGRIDIILDYSRVYFCLERAIYIPAPTTPIQFLPPSLEKTASQ